MTKPTLDEAEYLKHASRIASTYRHRSDPSNVAYTFSAGTLAEFVGEVEKAVLAKLAGKQEPLFWVRLYRDGSFRGPIHNGFIEDTWKASKMWTPLFTHPAPPTKPITKDAIRAAGGIVHSDGNIFFTNMAQIEALRENLK